MKHITAPNNAKPRFLFPAGQFTPPVPPKIYAPRTQLMDIINDTAAKGFIHMNAPAGSGKTVSALLWLNSCGRKPVWIGLDQYCSIPQVFYELLAAGLCSAQPQNSEIKNIFANPSFFSSPVESVIRLISKLKPCHELYALVLDDTHLISNIEILRSLPYVLRKLPSSFAVLTLSRGAPQEELKPLFNEKSVISAESLAFSESEIREYFDGAGRFLTPEEIRFVHKTTGGLPIGVNAAAKNRRIDKGNPGCSFETYVKDQLWEKWDKSLREFMLATSVADELTCELASRLTGTDGGETLDRLCAANYFVIRTGRDLYRYHPLFLEFLRKQARSPSPSSYKTAGNYYFENNAPYKALTYYIKSGDMTAVISALNKLTVYDASLSAAEHLANINLACLEKLAGYDCDIKPFILIRCALKYYLLGDAETMCEYLDKFYKLRDSSPAGIDGTIYLDHRKSLADLYEEAGTQINLAPFTMNMPFAHRSNRDASEYAYGIEGISYISGINPKKVPGNLYEIYISLIRAGLYYEKNMTDEAETELEMSAHSESLRNNPDFMLCHSMIKAATAQAKGDSIGMREAYSIMRSHILESHSEYLLPNYLAVKTKASLADADEKAAEEWLANYFAGEPERLELYKIYQHFTTARAHIVLNQPAKAMRYILRLKRLGTDFRRPLDSAEAGVLHSVLEWALGRKKEACAILEDTLSAIQPYGFINIIANEGASVSPILKRVAAKISKKDYKGSLTAEYLAALIETAQLRAKKQRGIAANVFSTGKQIKLSARQAQMLALIAQGKRNAEIAEIARLSVVTVKRHLTVLYAKLDACGSGEAVAKARERGLVE